MNWHLVEQSLCQIAGISPELECKLRRSGVTSAMLLGLRCDEMFPPVRAARIRASIERNRKFMNLGLTDAVVNAFPCGHRVRVLSDRFERACFLDIETDEQMHVTCISTQMGRQSATFFRGRNLDDFLDVWQKAELVVSFNGKRFDVPIIRRTFGLTRVPAQIDLMDEARHYGLAGGLKQIEKVIGFVRNSSVGMNGKDAIELWHRFQTLSDGEALERLKRYNREDVESLVMLYKWLLRMSLENRLIFDR